VLGRNLRAMQGLVNNSLAGVRLDAGLGQRRRVAIAELVGEAEVEASMEAEVGGFGLAVAPVAPDIEVEIDPQIVSAALGNLLQNAFKFSHRHGLVSLRTTATENRVLIEVEDECGGLPPGKAEDLFRPFERRSANQSGLSLGLTISRKGVEAMGGTIGVRDLPGKGCVFSIELPRLPAA
jgi:signal transduction histidine kinase